MHKNNGIINFKVPSTWDCGTVAPATARVQASLCIHAVSPEPLLLVYTKKWHRWRLGPKVRPISPLGGCVCMLEYWLCVNAKGTTFSCADPNIQEYCHTKTNWWLCHIRTAKVLISMCIQSCKQHHNFSLQDTPEHNPTKFNYNPVNI